MLQGPKHLGDSNKEELELIQAQIDNRTILKQLQDVINKAEIKSLNTTLDSVRGTEAYKSTLEAVQNRKQEISLEERIQQNQLDKLLLAEKAILKANEDRAKLKEQQALDSNIADQEAAADSARSNAERQNEIAKLQIQNTRVIVSNAVRRVQLAQLETANQKRYPR